MQLSDRWKTNGHMWVGGLLDKLGVAHLESNTTVSRTSLYKIARGGDDGIKLTTILDVLEPFYTPEEILSILEHGGSEYVNPNKTEFEL